VWAHIDTDSDGRVSRGDYINVQSFPVPAGSNPRLPVVLKRI
jgi:hypothetical protein